MSGTLELPLKGKFEVGDELAHEAFTNQRYRVIHVIDCPDRYGTDLVLENIASAAGGYFLDKSKSYSKIPPKFEKGKKYTHKSTNRWYIEVVDVRGDIAIGWQIYRDGKTSPLGWIRHQDQRKYNWEEM